MEGFEAHSSWEGERDPARREADFLGLPGRRWGGSGNPFVFFPRLPPARVRSRVPGARALARETGSQALSLRARGAPSGAGCGGGAGIPAGLQILGSPAQRPASFFRRATVGAEGAEDAAAGGPRGEDGPSCTAGEVVTATPLPPQV